MASGAVQRQVALEEARAKYGSVDALLESTYDGSLRPLSGKYLVGLAEGGKRLERRQALPWEAFYVPAQEELANMDPKDHHKVFIALSYRWLAQDHPDPAAFHLKIVAHFLRIHLGKWAECGVADVAMFWDFGSLHQKHRPAYQEELFKTGLKSSNVWYGSTHSCAWLQPCLPPGFAGALYLESGWCFVEASISSAVKDANSRWDLGKAEIDGLGNVSSHPTYLICFWGLKGDRLPPLSPSKVADLLKSEKTFTCKADVEVVSNIYDTFFSAVTSFTTKLSFLGCGWSAEHIRDFVEVLPLFTELRELHLGANELGSEGATIFASALQANATLQTLNLGENKVGDSGASALAPALQANTTLQTLSLNRNGVGESGASALAAALQANTTLQTLDLGFNGVGGSGASALAAVLQANTTLLTLDLELNEVGDSGASALAAALQANTTLLTLNLEGNKVGDSGASALAAALQANTTLQTLNLRQNKVGDSGASALAAALQANATLQTLDLGSNDVGDSGASALAAVLQVNTTLQTLKLGYNNVGADGASALAAALQANGNLKVDLRGNAGYKAFERKRRGPADAGPTDADPARCQ